MLDNIPKSINRRLSAISSNQEVFEAACQPYQDALKKSGHDFKLFLTHQHLEAKEKIDREKSFISTPLLAKMYRLILGKSF